MGCLARGLYFVEFVVQEIEVLRGFRPNPWIASQAKLTHDNAECDLRALQWRTLHFKQCYFREYILFFCFFFARHIPNHFAGLLCVSPCFFFFFKKPVAKTNRPFVTVFAKLVKWGLILRCTPQATSVHLFTALFKSASVYPASQTNPSAGFADSCLWQQWDTRSYQRGSLAVEGVSIKGICLAGARFGFRNYMEEMGTRHLVCLIRILYSGFVLSELICPLSPLRCRDVILTWAVSSFLNIICFVFWLHAVIDWVNILRRWL